MPRIKEALKKKKIFSKKMAVYKKAHGYMR